MTSKIIITYLDASYKLLLKVNIHIFYKIWYSTVKLIKATSRSLEKWQLYSTERNTKLLSIVLKDNVSDDLLRGPAHEWSSNNAK